MVAVEVAQAPMLYSVSTRLLRKLYGVMPFMFALIVLDAVLFNFQLRDDILPTTPANLLIWGIIFNFPHIVSSVITLADREYIEYYRTKLIRGLLLIVGGLFLVLYLAPMVLPTSQANLLLGLYILFHAGYTMWHVLSQQYGIGMMLMRKPPDRLYQLWRAFSMLAATVMYLVTFYRVNLEGQLIMGWDLLLLAKLVSGLFVLAATLIGIAVIKPFDSDSMKVFNRYNLAILPVVFVMLLLDYSLFVIMIPRFIHDITAFIIYSVHDQNRNLVTKNNVVYRALSFIPLAPWLLCPVLAISVAAMMECGATWFDATMGFNVVMPEKCMFDVTPSASNGLPDSMKLWAAILFSVSLFHYYIESFVWKRESIHRHSVRFT